MLIAAQVVFFAAFCFALWTIHSSNPKAKKLWNLALPLTIITTIGTAEGLVDSKTA